MNRFNSLGTTLAWAGAILCVVCVLASQPMTAGSSKDKNVEITKVEEPFNWTGFYIGGNAGGMWTNYDFSGYDVAVDLGAQANEFDADSAEFLDFNVFDVPGHNGLSEASIVGGGQLGYQHQFGHFVVGVEGEFQGLTSSATSRFVTDTLFNTTDHPWNTDTSLDTWRKIDNNWAASARLKLGYVRHRVMLYIIGGATWIDSTVRATDTASTNFFNLDSGDFAANVTDKQSSSDEGVTIGWTAGAGAEWAFTDIASMGFEYRHNGYGDESYNIPDHGGPIFPGHVNIDMDSDQVIFKVNVLLGRVGH